MASDFKMMRECFLCRGRFQFGPHIYEGKPIKAWGIEVCDMCLKSNWDGLVPETHPRLIKHFRDHGIPAKRNANGWIVWPGSN